jgi:hypothetical protein
MFDQLFFRSDASTHQLSASLLDKRRPYLAQCAAQEMSKCTLRRKARLLLSIAEYLRLAERSNDTISLPKIKKAASRWSSHNWLSPVAGIFHGAGGWMADLSQPSPDCAQAGNGPRPDVGEIQRLYGRRPRSFTGYG